MLGACKSNCAHFGFYSAVILNWLKYTARYFRIDLNVRHTEATGHADDNAGAIKLILLGQARLGGTLNTLSAS